jgi:hypothetical protein
MSLYASTHRRWIFCMCPSEQMESSYNPKLGSMERGARRVASCRWAVFLGVRAVHSVNDLERVSRKELEK